MTKYYLSKTATSPALTDTGPVSNTPTGAGNYTLHTPGQLVTTAPTFGAATTTTLSGSIGPSQRRGMIWETLAGVPNQATFTTPGWELCLRVTAFVGSGVVGTNACLINARIVRLDTTAGANNIVQIGGNGDGFAIADSGFSSHALPITATIQIPPSTFSAGSASDRLAVQVWVENSSAVNSITTFSVQTDSHFSFLSNELRLQFAEGADYIAPAGFNSSANCSPSIGGPGCGCGLFAAGVIPSNGAAGAARLNVGVGGSYTLVTGWNGTGHALQNPTNVQFNTENSKFRDTWHVGFRFRPDDLGATQQVVSAGSSSARGVSIDLLTNGTLQVYVGGSGAGAGSLKATSNNTALSAGTWYQIEFACYFSTTVGTLRVLVNGVEVTWGSAITGLNTGGAVTGCFWNTVHGTIDDMYGYAGQGSLTQVAYRASTTSLPIMATLLPVGQGSQHDFDNISHIVSNDAGVTNGVATTSNYTFLNETQNTGPLKYLQSVAGTGAEDLWIFDAAPEGTGEIIHLLTSFTCVGEAGNVFDSHEIRVGGTTYKTNDLPTGVADLDFEHLNVGAQQDYRARLWLSPAGDDWLASDLSAFEAGLCSLGPLDTLVSQARLIVMYYEALPEEESAGTGPCEPCTSTLDNFFVDSGLIYDGRNSVDGGTTISSSTMTLSLSPAGDWTTVGGEHLLTCSTALFTAGDSFYVGKAMRLTGDDGEEVVCDIIDHNAGDSTLDITIRSAVPISLQNIATSEWALMVDEITMAHLEGETIAILADGDVQEQEVVGRGTTALADHFAVVIAGLPIRAILQTLPIDNPNSPSSISDLPKDVPEVTIIVDATVSFEMGSGANFLDPVICDPDIGEHDLFSGKVKNQQRRGHQWGDGGGTRFEQNDPLHVTILGIVNHVEFGKH